MSLSRIYKGIKKLCNPTIAEKCKRLFIIEICIAIFFTICAAFMIVTEIIFGFGWLETSGIIMAIIAIVGAIWGSHEDYVYWKIFRDTEKHEKITHIKQLCYKQQPLYRYVNR